MPTRTEMPDTIKRSPKEAQRTWAKAHDNAVKEYGEGERAHRTAFAALKHSFEKVATAGYRSGAGVRPILERSGAARRRAGAKARRSAGSTTRGDRRKSCTSVPASWASRGARR